MQTVSKVTSFQSKKRTFQYNMYCILHKATLKL